MRRVLAIVWAFLLVLLLPFTDQYKLPPGNVSPIWYVCLGGGCSLVAYGVYYRRNETLGGRVLYLVISGVAVFIVAYLLLIWNDFAIETQYRMGRS